MRKKVVRYLPLDVQTFVVWYMLITTRTYSKLLLFIELLSTLTKNIIL